MTGATRTVSVLFTDLVGSTELSSRLGPVLWDPLLRGHLEDLEDALQRVGGTLVKSAGDGVMATLPSASAAVACAVAMQQGVDLRNRRSETPLAMRVGIAVGDAEEVDGDWYGRPPVEAKRLCDLAAGGQVLTTEAVRLLVQSADGPTLEPVGPLVLKGFPEPVAAASVVWEPLPADAGRPPLPPMVRALPTSVFVGRAEEQERLAAAWGRALEGERGLALVCGDPGIGKTTLAGTLAIAAHRHGAVVLYGRSERDVGLPYEPWRQALGQLVECAPAHVLHAHARRHGGALAALAPAFRDKVDDVPEYAPSDPETERYLLFAATLAILEDVAGRGTGPAPARRPALRGPAHDRAPAAPAARRRGDAPARRGDLSRQRAAAGRSRSCSRACSASRGSNGSLSTVSARPRSACCWRRRPEALSPGRRTRWRRSCTGGPRATPSSWPRPSAMSARWGDTWTPRGGWTGSTSPRASSRSSGAGSRAWATTRPTC